MEKKRIKSPGAFLFGAVSFPLIAIFAILCVLPFYLIVVASLTSDQAILTKGFSFIISDFSVEGYRLALKNPTAIVTAYVNTIFVTIIGTCIAVFICTMTGYVLSRAEFIWKNGLTFYFFFTMLFSGGLVPWYIMCTRYLGFKNSYYALILPGLFNVWNMIISKSFIKRIPDAIVESAKIDGANDFVIFIRLIIPISKPLLATLALFVGLSYWNDWYNCMLFISKDEMNTLQFYLQKMLTSSSQMRKLAEQSGISLPRLPVESLKMAMTVIVTGPILLLYPFLQKYFIKGLTVGAVKG